MQLKKNGGFNAVLTDNENNFSINSEFVIKISEMRKKQMKWIIRLINETVGNIHKITNIIDWAFTRHEFGTQMTNLRSEFKHQQKKVENKFELTDVIDENNSPIEICSHY
jgi:hypothetical protein